MAPRVWYNCGMRRTAASAAVLLCLAAALHAAGAEPPPPCSLQDARLMYNQAMLLLEDDRNSNVAEVPALLETAAPVYPRAAELLLKVYEGRKKGLPAEPQKAYDLALSMASRRPQQDPVAEEIRLHAMYSLACYHEKGYGWGKDDAEAKARSLQQAFRWMKKAADAGYDTAAAELGRYYMAGTGTAADTRKAWEILFRTARRAPRTPKVYLYLGTMCACGLHPQAGTRAKADPAAAVRLFHTGALYGDAGCMNNLGVMLERGIGTRRDVRAAAALYRRAAALGNKEASTNMQRLVFKYDDHAPRAGTPPAERINNALLCVIDALPVQEHHRSALRRLLLIPTEHAPRTPR